MRTKLTHWDKRHFCCSARLRILFGVLLTIHSPTQENTKHTTIAPSVRLSAFPSTPLHTVRRQTPPFLPAALRSLTCRVRITAKQPMIHKRYLAPISHVAACESIPRASSIIRELTWRPLVWSACTYSSMASTLGVVQSGPVAWRCETIDWRWDTRL